MDHARSARRRSTPGCSSLGPGPRLTLAAMIAALGAGCAVKQPPADLSRSQVQGVPERFAAATDPAQPEGSVQDNWLGEFGDERVLAMVGAAISHNPDLAVAAARWEEAQARLKVAGSFLQPQIDAFGTAQRADPGELPIANRFDLGMQVSWEADLWGRLRSQEEAARAAAQASGWQYEFARQSLAAAVVDAWFLAVTARLQIGINQQQVEAEQFTAKVTRDKIDVGAASQLDLNVAEANLALAEESLRQSQGALLEAQRALEILLGSYPSADLAVDDALPPLPPPPPVGLPSQLLERRPDLIAADRVVASAFYGVESARAAQLPRVALSASLGTMLDPTEAIWSIGANLLAPVFTGGRLQGEVQIATAQQRQALAQYVSVALRAFREVESALSNEQVLAYRQVKLERADEMLRSASRIADDRYNAGILNILDLTQVRRQDFANRSQLLRVRAERLRQRLNLHLALGGSFDTRETQP